MMKKTLLIIILLSMAFAASSQINHKHYILMGRIDLSKDQYVDAIRNLNVAITAKPEDFEAYFLRGIAKYSLGDFDGAVNDFTKTLEIHPLYVRAYHYRGLAHDRLSDYADAEKDYAMAVSLDPFSLDLHLAIGSTKMHLNQFEDAIAAFDTALLINPSYSNAYVNRGIAKRYLERLDDALEDMNKAVENDFFNVEALVRRGMIRLERKEYGDAMFDFNAAMRLSPDDPLIFFNRAVAYLNLGDTMAALADYERVNQLDQRNALTYFNRAVVYSMLGDYDVAEALYNKVIELNPENIYGYFNRGILFYKQEMWDEAEDDFTRVIQLFPDYIDAWLNRAAVRFEKNDFKGAEKDQYQARCIMDLVNDNNGNIDSLYASYSSKIGYDKIVNFEADFVGGDRGGSAYQYTNVDVKPFNDMIVNIVDVEKYKKGNRRKAYFVDDVLSRINEECDVNGAIAYIVNDIQSGNHVSMINGNENISDKDVALFVDGIAHLEICNYQKAESAFAALTDNKLLRRYAVLNLVAVQCAKAELVLAEEDFTSTVYLSDKKNLHQVVEHNVTPDYSLAENILATYLKTSPKDAFAWYDIGNIHLRQKDFERALTDYTSAVKYEPTLGEAYYNRALVLLFLGRPDEARHDLSKAGELGIDDAYVVMKRYL